MYKLLLRLTKKRREKTEINNNIIKEAITTDAKAINSEYRNKTNESTDHCWKKLKI